MIETFTTPDTRFLSNFWELNIPIKYEGYWFNSVEAAYQGAKAGSDSILKAFSHLNARESKAAGSCLKLQEDWHLLKLPIMEYLVEHKFKNNPDLMQMLLATGNQQLIEGNWWNDTYWGVCNGVGENHLGKILMRVRDENST